MNVLFVAAEMAPLAKTGGLADVVGELPLALARQGHAVRVVIPAYRDLALAGIPLQRLRQRVKFSVGDTAYRAGILAATIEGVTVWLLDLPPLFIREGLYGTPAGDFPDNHHRFATLCRGALAIVRLLSFRPHIIHGHDWHTALLPALLRWEVPDRFFAHTATVLTIHNLAFQGLFPPTALAELGLSSSWLRIERAEFYGQFSFLKAGLMAAEMITTVSPTYRDETLTPAGGAGLDGVLRQRGDDYVGILNGIDLAAWNPATDPRLPATYGSKTLAGKAHCKAQLQERLGLPCASVTPLFVMVSRLTEQKGCDLLLAALPQLAAMPLQLALLGTGDVRYLAAFQALAAEHWSNISFNLGFHPELVPLIYAGADLLLMPSRFEPCGISQLIALRYGTVPVVRRTGGLADTVTPATATTGTGFLFVDYTATDLLRAIAEALARYGDQAAWRRLVRRGMEADHSWERSVLAYEQVYARAMRRREERDERQY